MYAALLAIAWYGLLLQIPADRDVARLTKTAIESNVVPFRLSAGYLIEVQGSIGTQSGLKFLLDTGSTISIIDARVAHRMALQRRPAESFSFDRKLNWEVTSIPEIRFGSIKAENIQVFIGRLAEYSDFAKNADAIIGMDLLRLSNFSIDYDTRKISFRSQQRSSYTSIAAEPVSQCLIVEVRIQGPPFRLLVDTGFPSLLLYEERLRRRIPTIRILGSPKTVVLGGRLQAKQVVLPDVVLGAKNVEVSALLVKAPPPEVPPEFDGIIGLAALNAHRVHFNLEERKVSWE